MARIQLVKSHSAVNSSCIERLNVELQDPTLKETDTAVKEMRVVWVVGLVKGNQWVFIVP